MTTTNPTNLVVDGDGISVTIKYGKGYEETWAVFRGSNVDRIRAQICDYFGVDRASVSELTVSELVVNVTNLAHGKGNAAALLGATVIPSSQAGKAETAKPGEDVWSDDTAPGEFPAESAPAEPEGPNPVIALMEATASIPELQKVWAANQSAFKDADVMAAYKAKGKALQSVSDAG